MAGYSNRSFLKPLTLRRGISINATGSHLETAQCLHTGSLFVHCLTDNPYVPQAYIERIKRSSKATIERLLHGNFDYDGDPSKIFNYDKISDLFSNIHV